MTKAFDRIMEGATEALKIAKGDQPAPRIHINGFTYVSGKEHEALKSAASRLVKRMTDELDPETYYEFEDEISAIEDIL